MPNAPSTFSKFYVCRIYQHSKCSHFRRLLFSVHVYFEKCGQRWCWPSGTLSVLRERTTEVRQTITIEGVPESYNLPFLLLSLVCTLYCSFKGCNTFAQENLNFTWEFLIWSFSIGYLKGASSRARKNLLLGGRYVFVCKPYVGSNSYYRVPTIMENQRKPEKW